MMSNGATPCGNEIPQVFDRTPIDMEHVRVFLARAENLGYDSLWVQEEITVKSRSARGVRTEAVGT